MGHNNTPVMQQLYNNSLHKTRMMYRIVYTKLSSSLLSRYGIILPILSINTIYSARLFTLGCVSGSISVHTYKIRED